jgi:hypothetical protein
MKMRSRMRMNTGAMHRWLDNYVAGGEISPPTFSKKKKGGVSRLGVAPTGRGGP